MAITPNGAFAYVTASRQQFDVFSGEAWVIATTSNAIVASEWGDSEIPVGVAITPNGAFAYVTAEDILTGFDDVWVIATATNTVVATVPVGLGPVGVAITPF